MRRPANPSGFCASAERNYRMVARPLDPGFALALASRRPLVALHSAAAARHFSHEVDRLGIERGTLFLLVLGKRIAKAAGLGWAALHVAETPDDAALLVKAAALCK
jgi:uroporphyrinogen-III synthase